MQLKKIFITLLAAIPLLTAAQKTFTIAGNIAHLNNEKVFFRYYTDSKASYCDSLISASGKISFRIPDSMRGLSAIRVHNRPDLIIRLVTDGNNIAFNADANAAGNNPEIISSEANKTYYKYLQEKNIPKDDGSPAAIFARLQMPMSIPAGTGNIQQWQRDHFWDNTAFGDSAIIHTDLLRVLLNNYIALYIDHSLSFDQQTDTLCTALDKLLQRCTNDVVYNFMVGDLDYRFRYGSYDIVGAYLTQYYTSRFTLAKDYPLSEIRKRLMKLKHPTIGQIAPEIIMDAPRGGVTKMTDIKADHLLLVFWSIDCPHCKLTMPELKKIYDARKASFEVLAIAQDADKAAWQKYITAHGFTWINYTDVKGPTGKILQDYDVLGTPTFLLLDKDKKIISKPLDLEELKGVLGALKIL